MNASRRSPEPRIDVIQSYEPKHPEVANDTSVEANSWDHVFARVVRHDDDHGAKLVRALAHEEKAHLCCV